MRRLSCIYIFIYIYIYDLLRGMENRFLALYIVCHIEARILNIYQILGFKVV